MNKLSVSLVAIGLTLGACCNEDFKMPDDYDFFEGAIDITPYMNDCSPINAYTTVGATADGEAGNCWGDVALHNRWFKLTVPSSGETTVTVQVGTQLRTQMAFWSDKTTMISCATYSSDADNVNIYKGTLTPGQLIYISVNSADSQGLGTFTICVTDTD